MNQENKERQSFGARILAKIKKNKEGAILVSGLAIAAGLVVYGAIDVQRNIIDKSDGSSFWTTTPTANYGATLSSMDARLKAVETVQASFINTSTPTPAVK